MKLSVGKIISCKKCGDERFLLIGCCGGFECGCMGMPVAFDECRECNADGKAEPGDYVKSFMRHLEHA